MSRSSKGTSVARYLLGSTGIPGISWGPRDIQIPSPYSVGLTTDRALWRWHEQIGAERTSIHMAIRYDAGMDSVGQAWVGMQLHQFAPLLQAHYEQEWKGRTDAP